MTATELFHPAFAKGSRDELGEVKRMSRLKYVSCLAITVAVLLDLYAGKPDGEAGFRVMLDLGALFLAVGGLAGLASGNAGQFRR